MADFNPEPNLAEWRQTVREIVDSPRVSRYLDALDQRAKDYLASLPEEERTKIEFSASQNHKTHLYQTADLLLPEQDKQMKGYAGSWAEVSRQHAESGLYRQVVNFFKPEQGLLVDLGCGAGRFLAEMPEPAIGVDINHYSLQAAESVLSERGRSVRRYSRSYISFDPDKGFILKPYPVMDEIDLTGTTLLADDIENLHNTMRVLYNQGRKADMVSFTLSGGYTNKSPLQFIEFMQLGDKEFWEQRRIVHDKDIMNSVLDNASKICRSDGRFFLGSRLSMYDAERNEYVDKHEELGQEIAKQHPNVDVVRTTYIPMIQEQGMHGIQIDSRLQLPDGSLLPIPMDLKDVTYSLYLFDMRVR